MIGLTVTLLVLPSLSAEISRCVLQVDGRGCIDGPCEFEGMPSGGFTIGVSDRVPMPYFAYISIDGGVARGFWNEERGAGHAHSPLGALRRAGACWINERARVCAFR